ncbi:hypothetical protein B296_00044108, partial [Ensete ventricosum]
SLVVANLSSGMVTALWLSKGAAAIAGRRATYYTFVAEEGISSVERVIATSNLCSEGSLLAMNKENGSERSLLVALVEGSERSLLVAFVPQESTAGCDGSERLLPVALCNERSLLVMIKSLLVAIKVNDNKRSLLPAIKEDGSERSLLVVLCNERSLLVMINSLLVAIKVDGSIYAARDMCCG